MTRASPRTLDIFNLESLEGSSTEFWPLAIDNDVTQTPQLIRIDMIHHDFFLLNSFPVNQIFCYGLCFPEMSYAS